MIKGSQPSKKGMPYPKVIRGNRLKNDCGDFIYICLLESYLSTPLDNSSISSAYNLCFLTYQGVEFKVHKTQEGGDLCIDKCGQTFANSQLACLDWLFLTRQKVKYCGNKEHKIFTWETSSPTEVKTTTCRCRIFTQSTKRITGYKVTPFVTKLLTHVQYTLDTYRPSLPRLGHTSLTLYKRDEKSSPYYNVSNQAIVRYNEVLECQAWKLLITYTQRLSFLFLYWSSHLWFKWKPMIQNNGTSFLK